MESLSPRQRKSLLNFSLRFNIKVGAWKRDMVQVGRASRMLLIKVTLLPKERYCFFPGHQFLSIFSRNPFHIVTDMCFSQRQS